jgi:hypothetical protein
VQLSLKVYGSGGTAPPFVTLHQMEVSGQLHVLDALSLGAESPIPSGQEDGWAPELVWTLWNTVNLAQARSQTPTAQPVAHHYTD